MIFRSLLISSLLCGLSGAAGPSLFADDQQPPSTAQLVRITAANEIASSGPDGMKHMFHDRKKTPQGSQTRIYIETRDGMAGMTVAYDDKPLSPKQMQDEEGRLAGLVNNPDQLRHKQHEQKEDADRTLRIMKALPDAFFFENNGTVPGTASVGRLGVNLIRLKFRPNPTYHAPSRVEEVLVGMSGTILIDPMLHRIAEIDGTLTQPVSFGWGILGHLDRGGHFLVYQTDVGENCWEISQMSLSFTGRILLFKSFTFKSDEVFSDFRRVPNDTTFAQGVKLLETESGKFANGSSQTADAQSAPR